MRLLHILGLLTLSAQIYAVPTRFHVFRAQMSDGTFQNIRFCGDEYRSYYVNEKGFLVEKEETGRFRVTSLRPRDKEKTASVRAMRASSQDRVAIKPLGSPRIPVILVNFSDEKLTVAETAKGIADYYDISIATGRETASCTRGLAAEGLYVITLPNKATVCFFRILK
ncbi:MAG: hypothetical protein ACLRPS_14270 [Paraprevotella clara]